MTVKPWRAALAGTAGALALLAGQAMAQGRPVAAPAAVSAPEADRVLAEVERLVRENYVDAAKKPAVLAALTEGRRSGRYRVDSPQELAVRVTQDLQRTTQDGHMSMTWDPTAYAGLRAAAAQAGAGDDGAIWLERARRGNAGLETMRILAGNVRYLKLGAFLWDPETSPAAYDGAMAFLKGGDATIIDLRGNGGGSPDAVNYLTSHFVPADTPLMTFVMPDGEQKSVSRRETPAGRMMGKPLYVLTDKGVASAGEEFALHVDKLKLGELVGETTAGAGNRNELYPIAPGYQLSVSVGLAKHATDGSGWEGVGVRPHVPVPPATALDVAHARALERLAATGSERYRAQYAWAAEGVKGRAQPPALSVADLGRYVGTFGERSVRLEADKLVYQRQGGPALTLTPIGAALFALGDGDGPRLAIELRDGRATAAELRHPDGRRNRFERTG